MHHTVYIKSHIIYCSEVFRCPLTPFLGRSVQL